MMSVVDMCVNCVNRCVCVLKVFVYLCVGVVFVCLLMNTHTNVCVYVWCVSLCWCVLMLKNITLYDVWLKCVCVYVFVGVVCESVYIMVYE